MDIEEPDFIDVFQWSLTEYDLKTFHQDYKKHFPCLVRITSGYAGAAEQQMNEIGVDEMYWIFGVQKQKRIVAKNTDDLYISIPLETGFKFQTVDRKEPLRPPGPSTSLKQLIQSGKGFQGQQIIFEDDQEVSVLAGADAGNRTHLGRMEILDSYNEKYLLANSVIENSLHEMVLGIPVFMPVQLVVAVGLRNFPDEQFTKLMEQLDEVCRSFNQRTIEPCKEILLFDEAPEYDYEYIEPRSKLHVTECIKSKTEDKGSSAQVLSRDQPATNNQSSFKSRGIQRGHLSISKLEKLARVSVTKPTGSQSEDDSDSYEYVEDLATYLNQRAENFQSKSNTKAGHSPFEVPGMVNDDLAVEPIAFFMREKTENPPTYINLQAGVVQPEVRADPPPFEVPGIVKGDSVDEPLTIPLKETALLNSSLKPAISFDMSDTVCRKVNAVQPQVSNAECPLGVDATGSDSDEEIERYDDIEENTAYPYENVGDLAAYIKQRTLTFQSEHEALPPRLPPRSHAVNALVKKQVPSKDENAASANKGKQSKEESTPPVPVNLPETTSSVSSPKSPRSGLRGFFSKVKPSNKSKTLQKDLQIRANPSPFESPEIAKGESVVTSHTVIPSKETVPPCPKPKPIIEPVVPYTIHRKIEAVRPVVKEVSGGPVGTASPGLEHFNRCVQPQNANPAVCVCSPEISSTESSSVNIASSGYTYPNDLPPVNIDLAKLSIDEVHRCVKMIGITGDKADLLKDANVDGTLLLNLDVDILVNDFGFRTFDAKKLMMFAKDGWRPKKTSETVSL